MKHIALTICMVFFAFVGAVTAAPLDRFTSFSAFGDSLTDDGNLFSLTGIPPAPYYNGRFSNGPVWSDHVASEFAANGRFTYNDAYGGARAIGPQPLDPSFPLDISLSGQIDRFVAAFPSSPNPVLGSRPLAALWAGANDLFQVIGAVSQSDAIAVGKAAAQSVMAQAARLNLTGIKDVLIFNLPDLGATPRFAFNPFQTADASAVTQAYNAELAMGIDALRAAGANVYAVDTASLFEDLLADPFSFGVLNATIPCLIPGIPNVAPPSYCGAGVAPSLAFFDPVHPNATIHAALSREASAVLATVPLPASVVLLLVGLAGLGTMRPRRASLA
jgi:outer membrane lipase/esterase